MQSDFRNEQAPPSKKELARQKELFNAVLAGVSPAEAAGTEAAGDDTPSAVSEAPVAAETAAPVKSKKKKA